MRSLYREEIAFRAEKAWLICDGNSVIVPVMTIWMDVARSAMYRAKFMKDTVGYVLG
jgi:hypothetical protein